MTNNANFVIAGCVIAATVAIAAAARSQPPQCPKGPGWFLSPPSPGDGFGMGIISPSACWVLRST
jgi:hypothetical protein